MLWHIIGVALKVESRRNCFLNTSFIEKPEKLYIHICKASSSYSNCGVRSIFTMFVLIKAIAVVLHVEIVFSHFVQSTKWYRRSISSVWLLHLAKVNCFYILLWHSIFLCQSARSVLTRYMNVQSIVRFLAEIFIKKMDLVVYQRWLTYVLFLP